MKTPIQELIEYLETWILDDKHVQDNPMKYEEYMVQHANQMVSVKRDFVILCESMLEKEEEMIVRSFMNVSDDRDKRLEDVHLREFAEDYYNETFKTKER